MQHVLMWDVECGIWVMADASGYSAVLHLLVSHKRHRLSGGGGRGTSTEG